MLHVDTSGISSISKYLINNLDWIFGNENDLFCVFYYWYKKIPECGKQTSWPLPEDPWLHRSRTQTIHQLKKVKSWDVYWYTCHSIKSKKSKYQKWHIFVVKSFTGDKIKFTSFAAWFSLWPNHVCILSTIQCTVKAVLIQTIFQGLPLDIVESRMKIWINNLHPRNGFATTIRKYLTMPNKISWSEGWNIEFSL